MASYRVVVTDQVFPDTVVERELLAAIDAELVVADGEGTHGEGTHGEGMLELAAGADALLNTYAPLPAEAVRRLQRCRVIARYGIGVDNIDLEAARAAGIAVTNVPDYCVEEVAVHTVALLLALHRKVTEADRMVRSGRWGLEGLRPIRRFSDLTVGLVGYGRIARRVRSALAPLAGRVIATDPNVADPGDGTEMVAFDELLATSDAVSLHTPLSPETRGMVARGELARMRDTALLVNTSRGPLVDLGDLLEALRAGAVAGAALDVLDREPLDDVEAVRGVPNLVLTPHMAYYSEAAIRESQRKAATQVVKALTGQDLDYRVN